MLAREPQAVCAVRRHVDSEALGLQPVAEARREPLLIFDHQHPHQRPTYVFVRG